MFITSRSLGVSMEEELVATAATDAVVTASFSPEEIKQRADDERSHFRSKTALDECSNCHTNLQGRYCHACGQIADTFHRPLWSLFIGVFDGLFGLDGRIWKTVLPLFFRPGEMTFKYLSGIRKPFIQPFKLFLASAIVFFLVFAMAIQMRPANTLLKSETAKVQVGEFQNTKPDNQSTKADAKDKAQPNLDKALLPVTNETEPARLLNQDRMLCDIKAWLIPEEATKDCLELASKSNKQLEIQLMGSSDTPQMSLEKRKFLASNLETIVRDPSRYLKTLARWAPRIAFVLAPVYGLLLAASFFWRRDLFVYDHMIVALHFHAFLFLLLTLLVMIGLVAGNVVTVIIFFGWSNFYLYQLQRRVYDCNWAIALLRTMVLDGVYFVILSIAFIVLLVLGVLFV